MLETDNVSMNFGTEVSFLLFIFFFFLIFFQFLTYSMVAFGGLLVNRQIC